MVTYKELKFFKSVNEYKTLDDSTFGVSTDSRNVNANDLFVAITGENFNAMNFLVDVKKSGCKIK